MNQEVDWKLIERYVLGKCSSEEAKKIQEWLQSHPENQNVMEYMELIWNTPEVQYPQIDIEQSWNKFVEDAEIASKINHVISKTILPRINEKIKSSYRWWFMNSPRYLKVAAILLFFVGGTYFLTKDMSIVPSVLFTSEMEEIQVANGKQAKITLSDGTIIILDAGSVLSYPEQFNDITHNVVLYGEGYFEVSPDRVKPFINLCW